MNVAMDFLILAIIDNPADPVADTFVMPMAKQEIEMLSITFDESVHLVQFPCFFPVTSSEWFAEILLLKLPICL